VLSILVYSGIVLLPVLLPVAGTDRGLELTAAAGISPKNDEKNNSAPELPEIQRLALSNIQVICFFNFPLLLPSISNISQFKVCPVIINKQKLFIYIVNIRSTNYMHHENTVITYNLSINSIFLKMLIYSHGLLKSACLYTLSAATKYEAVGISVVSLLGFLCHLFRPMEIIQACFKFESDCKINSRC